ncbi:TPA: hypothetical protein QHU17_004599 [Enterobacter hormaechei subsp. xiangfangensis]|nr:hypothetical protein [Enterobacter hormaechei subsp. xiangfangensis]
MKFVTITANCISDNSGDFLRFDAELNNKLFISTKQRLNVNGFADGNATWGKIHYSICLSVRDESKGLAGISWDDKDTMTANILNRRIDEGVSFTVSSAHGDFIYQITKVVSMSNNHG